MSNLELKGKVQTVLGLISTEDLGITLSHDHILVDFSGSPGSRGPIPSTASEREWYYRTTITMEDLSYLRYHPMANLEVCKLCNEAVAISELLRYKYWGGKSIVEPTLNGVGRDPLGLARVARATGLNIIMSSGYYIGPTHPEGMDTKTEEEITEEIIKDITDGVGNTGIKAGVIKAGCSWPLMENERKVLRACAVAQQRTGAQVMIHPGLANPKSVFEIIEVLNKAGGDISRTTLLHTDVLLRDSQDRRRLAETGCFTSFDVFGWESYNTFSTDQPNDSQRINDIMELISLGHIDHIVVSQDVARKTRIAKYGGHGYSHILENVVPLMKQKGMTEKQIHTILVENPKRLLEFT